MTANRPTASPWREALKASRMLLWWALLFSAAINILYLGPSLFMMQVYDRVLQSGGVLTLLFIGAILLFALSVLAFLDTTRTRLMARFSHRLDRLLSPVLLGAPQQRDQVAERERRQGLRAFDQFRAAITGPAASAVMDAPWSPLYVIVCAFIHPLIGLVAFGGGALLVGIAMLAERAMAGAIARAGELGPRLYAAQEADAAVAEPARALGMRGVLINRRLQHRGELRAAQAEVIFGSASYGGVTRFLRLALQSTALGVGAWLAINNQITPGALIAGSILAARALAPLDQIVGAWRQIGEARAAFALVRRVLETSGVLATHTNLPTPRGAVRIERVSVRAPGVDRWALQDVSLSIAPGEALGVIGPSGAGKSTLARVVAGALSPDAGIVRVDNASYADWDSDALGAHVGYLPQEVALLAGGIAENIRRFAARDDANSAAIDAAVVEAARLAGAHDMILRLPGGYDAELGLGGRGLSLGQAQRIGLARALYGAPALLVLDEPNAHLDQEGENALIEAVKAAKARGASTLIVAHRAGVLTLADRLAVLRDGKLEALGPREDVTAAMAAGARSAAGLALVRSPP